MYNYIKFRLEYKREFNKNFKSNEINNFLDL